MAEDKSTLALVEEAGEWAADQDALHKKIKPLAEHFTEVSGACVTQVLIAVAKALECGIYLGKFGFPGERTPLPESVKKFINEMPDPGEEGKEEDNEH
jgi:hypothetical protein